MRAQELRVGAGRLARVFKSWADDLNLRPVAAPVGGLGRWPAFSV